MLFNGLKNGLIVASLKDSQNNFASFAHATFMADVLY
jgi:hypothetical protein